MTLGTIVLIAILVALAVPVLAIGAFVGLVLYRLYRLIKSEDR